MSYKFILKGQTKGQPSTVTLLPKMIVGRESSVQLVLEGASISRQHALLEVSGGSVFVSDMGSRNGTLVNDRRVHVRTQVNTGDTLKFGDSRWVLQLDGQTDATVFSAKAGLVGDNHFLEMSEGDTTSVQHDMALPVGSHDLDAALFQQFKASSFYTPFRKKLIKLKAESTGNYAAVLLVALNQPEFATKTLITYDHAPRKFTVGRDEGQAVQLDFPSVSKSHADIVFDGEQWRVVDKQAKNGLWQNDRKVASVALDKFTIFRVGAVVMLCAVV